MIFVANEPERVKVVFRSPFIWGMFGFDCSSFCSPAYANGGIGVHRTSSSGPPATSIDVLGPLVDGNAILDGISRRQRQRSSPLWAARRPARFAAEHARHGHLVLRCLCLLAEVEKDPTLRTFVICKRTRPVLVLHERKSRGAAQLYSATRKRNQWRPQTGKSRGRWYNCFWNSHNWNNNIVL
jgi:hypothetical protein